MKVIIVGGVAGGASCAARLRRLDEKSEILMVERGPYVSYANCGLPYHVGGVIENGSSLLVASEELFRGLFAVDCRTRCEVIGISPQEKTVEIQNLETGELSTEGYDKLGLSPGAAPIRLEGHPPDPHRGISTRHCVPAHRLTRVLRRASVDRGRRLRGCAVFLAPRPGHPPDASSLSEADRIGRRSDNENSELVA